MKPGSKVFLRWTKPPLFLLALAPAIWAAVGAFAPQLVSLGANPVETLMDHFGIWGLRFLLISLAITPLQRLTGALWLVAYRRMLGLFAFFYITLHFVVYAWLDLGLDLSHVIEDIAKRPFITIGFAAFLMLIPLAVTSTRGFMRRLGKRWKQLHRAVYFIAVLGVWHYYWQVKLDTVEPTIYAIILAVLLGYRLYSFLARRRRHRERSAVGNQSARVTPSAPG